MLKSTCISLIESVCVSSCYRPVYYPFPILPQTLLDRSHCSPRVMWTHFHVLCLFVLLRSSTALEPGQLTEEQRAMDMWDNPNDPELWRKDPTWHKVTQWQAGTDENAAPGYLAGLTLANAYYNWVITQSNARLDDTGILIVSKTRYKLVLPPWH